MKLTIAHLMEAAHAALPHTVGTTNWDFAVLEHLKSQDKAAGEAPGVSDERAQWVEEISQQWDGCMYDAGPGGDIDIGAAIRTAWANREALHILAAPGAPDLLKLAQECGATVYRNRASPHAPAIAFGDESWEKFSKAVASPGAPAYDGCTTHPEFGGAPAPVAPTETEQERALSQVIDERDSYHEWADKLAAAIAEHFGVDIGEHSSINNPWAEALDAFSEDGAPTPVAVTPEPIDMVLHCPDCGQQHIDSSEQSVEHDFGAVEFPAWDNPPHRSHLCHYCGCIWRPADVPTNGVKTIKTKGNADTWEDGQAAQAHHFVQAAYVDAAAMVEAEDPRTSDWVNDDRHALADAIRNRGNAAVYEFRAALAATGTPGADRKLICPTCGVDRFQQGCSRHPCEFVAQACSVHQSPPLAGQDLRGSSDGSQVAPQDGGS